MKEIQIRTTFSEAHKIRAAVPKGATMHEQIQEYEIEACMDCYLHLFHAEGNEDPSPEWSPEDVDRNWPATDFYQGKIWPDFSGWDLDDLRREVDQYYIAQNPVPFDEDDETVADDAEWWAKYGAEVRAYLETWWEDGEEDRAESWFSWCSCDVCGSTLGGSRYNVVASTVEITITGPDDVIDALKP